MPRLSARALFTSPRLSIRRVACDGVDQPRPPEEGGEDARVIVVAQGRFGFADGRGRGVASPARGLFLPDGHRYTIRHIEGGDECVALRGDLCRLLAEAGPILRPVTTAAYLRLGALVARLARGEPSTALAIEEELAGALAPPVARGAGPHARDRSIAEAIAYELEREPDARHGLAALAGKAGVSVFHACRVFKRVTGLPIHRYQQEVRLRHALAWLLGTDRPLARIAADSGFSSQAHFTSVFRRRFQATPGRVRAKGLQGGIG